MIAATSLSVFGNLLSAGLARIGTLAFHKLSRINKIEQQLKSGGSQISPLRKALSDFEIVLGRCYGPYTDTLNTFVEELQRTGIIGLIAEEAALNRPEPASKAPFCRLHEAFFPKAGGDADRLFHVIYDCFQVSLREQVHDKTLGFYIRALDHSLEARLDSWEQALRDAGSRPFVLPEDSYRTLRFQILRGLQSSYRTVRVETNRGARMIDINRIYIPSKVRFRAIPDILAEEVQTSRKILKRGGIHYFHSTSMGVIDYKNFRNRFSRAVVLGDPGGGKSTLCQYLCFELGKESLTQLQSVTAPRRDQQLQKIPIRVVLRSFERARKSEPQLDLLCFIAREVRNVTSMPIQDIERTLTQALERGQAALAFDGLDEILETSLRRDFVELVVAFCDRYPLCPVCVTSRLVGYEEARLPESFEEVYLEKFDDDEVIQYVQKFLKVVAKSTNDDARRDAVAFMGQTETNAHDLRQNPLLLGLMTWLFYMTGDVPTNRPEVYSECAILMFEKWDQRRGIEAKIPTDFDMLHLFSYLAARMYGKLDLEDGVSTAWLTQELKRFFEAQYEDRARAHGASRALVDFITGRAWVMSEVGQDVFRFTHRTFL